MLPLVCCLATLPLSACLSDDSGNADKDGGDGGGDFVPVEGEGEGEGPVVVGGGEAPVSEGEGELGGEGEGEPGGEGEGEGEVEDPGPDARHIERCMAACGVAEDCGAINAFVPANDFDGCVEVCLQRYELTEDPHGYDIVTTCITGGDEEEDNGRCGRINHCSGARLAVPAQCDVICEPALACGQMAPFEDTGEPWLTNDDECRYGCAGFMWLIGPYAAGQGWDLDDEWAQCAADFIADGACGDGPMGGCLFDIAPECAAAADAVERCTPEEQRDEEFDAFGFALGCSFNLNPGDAGEADPNYNTGWVRCVAEVPIDQDDAAYCAEAYTCIDPGCRSWIDVIARCSPEGPGEDFNAAGAAIYCDGQVRMAPEDRDEEFNVDVVACLEGVEPNPDGAAFCAAAQQQCFGPLQEQDPCVRFCDKHRRCDVASPFGDADCRDACRGALLAGGPGFELRVACVNDGYCEQLADCVDLPVEPSPECVALCTGVVADCGFGAPDEEGGEGEGEGDPEVEAGGDCLRGCTSTLAGRGLDIGDVSTCLNHELTPHCGEDGDGDMAAAGAKLWACLAHADCHGACGVVDGCGGLDEGESLDQCIGECGNNRAADPREVADALACLLEEDRACQDLGECVGDGGGDGEAPPPE